MTAPSALNETHDPRLLSWVDSANDPSTDFPVQNLPFGVFRRRGHDESRIEEELDDAVDRLAKLLASFDPITGMAGMDRDKLDEWLAGPMKMVPGTRMVQIVRSDEERAALGAEAQTYGPSF